MKRFAYKLHLLTWTTDDRDSENTGGGTGIQLLNACKNGDRSAQKRLFDMLAPKMYSVCLRYMGDRESAEDILQEGFITLFTRLDSFSERGSFEGWARKIFVNTALMHLRRTDALKLSDDIEVARGLDSDTVTPVQDLGYKELMKMVAALPAGFRTVFNMYVIEGWSHKDISEALGISEATSRSKLQRARLKLQEMIKNNL